MLARNDCEFEAQCQKPGTEFTVQVITRGTVTDAQTEFRTDRTVQALYLVETTTIRVNPTAQKMWMDSKPLFGTPEENGLTRDELEEENGKRSDLREEFKAQIREDLGISDEQGSFAIGHILREFFTVVTIRKIAETPETTETTEGGD